MSTHGSGFGGVGHAAADRALSRSVVGQWQVIEAYFATSECDDDIGEAEFHLLHPIRHLLQDSTRCVGTLCERMAFGHWQAEVESLEVHGNAFEPKGSEQSIPRVTPHRYPQVMDIYDLRREIVEALVTKKFGGNKSAFAVVIGAAPSYVSRMLQPQTNHLHKKIGEEMARKLEGIPELGLRAGQLLDPVGNEFAPPPSAVTLSPSEWGTLQDMRDMTDEDQAFLRREAEERATRFRAMRKKILEQAGIHGSADPASVTKALGGVPKTGEKNLSAIVTETPANNVSPMSASTTGQGKTRGRMIGGRSKYGELGEPEEPKRGKS